MAAVLAIKTKQFITLYNKRASNHQLLAATAYVYLVLLTSSSAEEWPGGRDNVQNQLTSLFLWHHGGFTWWSSFRSERPRVLSLSRPRLRWSSRHSPSVWRNFISAHTNESSLFQAAAALLLPLVVVVVVVVAVVVYLKLQYSHIESIYSLTER